MKIEQKLVKNGITTTLSVEVPLQAAKTLIGDARAVEEFLGMELDIRLEAHSHICEAVSAALLEMHYQVYGSLLKTLLEHELGDELGLSSGAFHQPTTPETS